MLFNSKLYDKASGSIGNLTGSNSAGGLVFRRKPNRKQVASKKQLSAQRSVASGNRAWRAMRADIMDDWIAYGKTLKITDDFNNTRCLSGYEAFIKAYLLFSKIPYPTIYLLLQFRDGKGFYKFYNHRLFLKDNGSVLFMQIENLPPNIAVNVCVSYGEVSSRNITKYRGSYIGHTYTSFFAGSLTQFLNFDLKIGRTFLQIQFFNQLGRVSRVEKTFFDYYPN